VQKELELEVRALVANRADVAAQVDAAASEKSAQVREGGNEAGRQAGSVGE
jgi:hypothetical protein